MHLGNGFLWFNDIGKTGPRKIYFFVRYVDIPIDVNGSSSLTTDLVWRPNRTKKLIGIIKCITMYVELLNNRG